MKQLRLLVVVVWVLLRFGGIFFTIKQILKWRVNCQVDMILTIEIYSDHHKQRNYFILHQYNPASLKRKSWASVNFITKQINETKNINLYNWMIGSYHRRRRLYWARNRTKLCNFSSAFLSWFFVCWPHDRKIHRCKINFVR